MHKKVKNRLISVVAFVFTISLGVFLILRALEDNITFFYTPTQILSALKNQNVRVGGLVKNGSLVKIDEKCVRFILTDESNSELNAEFCGNLPIIFREGQGAILKGSLCKFGVADGKCKNDSAGSDKYSEHPRFLAKELLTKHDEKYMPPTNYKKLNKD